MKLTATDPINLHTAVEEDINAVEIGVLPYRVENLLGVIVVNVKLDRSRGERYGVYRRHDLKARLLENILNAQLLKDVLSYEILEIGLTRMIDRP